MSGGQQNQNQRGIYDTSQQPYSSQGLRDYNFGGRRNFSTRPSVDEINRFTGGGVAQAVQRLLQEQMQNQGQNISDYEGGYPGMQYTGGRGLSTPAFTPAANTNYGHLGAYNTLAQDMMAQQTGRFGFNQGGNPFQYMAAQGRGGRPGISGYSGIGPFQNQGSGQIPGGFQTSGYRNRWAGSPYQQPYSPYGGYGGGYGSSYGGYGQRGFGNPYLLFGGRMPQFV